MVALDPDTEFNALTALYASVVSDMKSSYPAWETVGQRAQKLAVQLKGTATSLAAFNDALQHVSDLANNLKGASRDVGACVTRICMRQRALEGRLKAVGDALSDELSVSVQQRTTFWKQRTHDMDKAAGRHIKKVRSRKTRPDHGAVTAQRALCSQLLHEQRTQLSFFVNALLPVLSSCVSLLDEGSHIRPVVDSLEGTLKHVDEDALVHTILADLTQGADNAWRTCLATAGHSTDGNDRPNGMTTLVSHYDVNEGCSMDTTLIAQPPTTTPCRPLQQKPPLGRRSSATTISVPPTPNGDRDQGNGPISQVPSLSSFRGCLSDVRPIRPQSFAGDLRPAYATPIATPTVYSAVYGEIRASTFSVPSSGCGGSSTGGQSLGSGGENGINGGTNGHGAISSSCSSSEAASMIAETLQQIDRLGSELETFCTHGETQGKNGLSGGEYASSDVMVRNGGAVRVRHDCSRPPPPERRSSQITSATPSAPSVADARLSVTSSSLRGSRQSLNSNPSSNFPCPPSSIPSSTQPPYTLVPPSYRPPSQHYATGNINHYALPRPAHF